MTYKIEKNVPMTEIHGRGRRTKYPFAEMEVGDSFTVPYGERARISSAAIFWGKDRGKKFSIRKIDDSHCRCWRVA